MIRAPSSDQFLEKLTFSRLKLTFSPLKLTFSPLKLTFSPLKVTFRILKLTFSSEFSREFKPKDQLISE